jgi:phage-related protein
VASGVLVGRGYVSIRPEFEGDWSRQANARASSAGRSGAGAFAKAFNGGLRGIGALAGIAIASHLSGAAAAAAAAAPALATVGAAAGALKLGLSGVGEAFKAAFADTSKDASAAASATRQVESAQRGLANAQRALADARVQAAERVRDAQQQVRDAERDLTDAQRSARDAQGELNDARREAARALQDMNQRLAESHLDEREAVLRLKEATAELKSAQQKPGTDPDDLARLQIAYERARLNLTEQRRETNRLSADTKKANKAGVEGSEQVVSAKQHISEANRDVADKERALAQAQAGVDKARRDGQRQIADAQRGVAEAAAALAEAQAAAAAQTSALDQAMSKLAPNARSFVNAVRGLKPAWDSMRLSVQDALFAGLDARISSLGRSTIPTLKKGLTGTATELNYMAKSAMDAVAELQKTGMLEEILAGANRNLAQLRNVPGQLVTAFGQLTVAAQPAFEGLLAQFGTFATRASEKLNASFQSGALEQSINTAFGILFQLGTVMADAFGVVANVMKAAAGAGGDLMGVIGSVIAELRRVTALPEVQAAMRAVFQAVAQIASALAPLIGAALQALAPIVAALAPVVQQVGTALAQIVTAITPLLAPIGQLITVIVSALAPALTPVMALITGLVNALAGPLTTLVSSLAPVFQLIGQLIQQVFGALAPIIQPIVTLVSQVANLLVGLFAQALGIVLQAVRPLIAVGVQLVQTVFRALAPLLPTIGQLARVVAQALGQIFRAVAPLLQAGVQLIQQVFKALAPLLPVVVQAVSGLVRALIQLLPPIVQIVTRLMGQFAPVLRQIVPVLAGVARTLVSGLVAVLPIVVQVVMILLGALRPLFPLIAQIAGIVLKLGATLLMALLPPLAQLLKAAVQLLIAFLPILPPIAKLIALVVRLAVGVLAWLLPPLIRLASWLITVAVKVLGVVIGWVAKLVTWVAKKLGPAFTWLWNKAKAVFAGIRAAVSVWWTVTKALFTAAWNWIRGKLGPVFTWLKDKAVRAWNLIKSGISAIWNKGIKPAFNAIKKGVRLVSDAFDAARKGIAKAWNKIKEATKKPIKWVIDVVYNKGIVGLWNKAASVLPITKLKTFKPKGFARGGILPGQSSYRQGDDQLVPMRRGEGVYVSEAMRDPYERARLHAVNRAAMHGGSLTKFRDVGYAKGGIIGDGLSKIGGLIKSGLGKAKEWALGGVTAAAKLAAKPIRSLLDKIPGGTSSFGKLAVSVPKGLLDAVISGISSGESSATGGAGVARALKWARGQAGKPYQWGGAGNPSWDCSGFMSGIQKVIQGKNPKGRMWSTFSFSGNRAPAGWKRHAKSPFEIGITNKGKGHTAGTLAGVNVESRGGDGVIVGSRARGAHSRMFGSNWYGFLPARGGGGGNAKDTARQMLGEYGWSQKQWPPLNKLWQKESGWRWNAKNPSSGAYGIPQALPASKMKSAGTDWRTNPATQIKWGLKYIKGRYGSPAKAWAHSQRTNWYDAGGWLQPGVTTAVNGTGQPEAILTAQQWRTMQAAAAGGDGASSSGGEFTGDLYLDSGEFMGKVRGVVRQENAQVLTALGARPRR